MHNEFILTISVYKFEDEELVKCVGNFHGFYYIILSTCVQNCYYKLLLTIILLQIPMAAQFPVWPAHGRVMEEHCRVLAEHYHVMAVYGRVIAEHGHVKAEHNRDFGKTRSRHGRTRSRFWQNTVTSW